MGFALNCNSGGANTGNPQCRGQYGRIKFFILVPPGQEIATETLALTQSTWTDGVENDEATRWYPLPEFFRYAPTREDGVYTQGDYGDKRFVRNGFADGVAHYLDLDVCFIKKLHEFSNKNWKGWAVTENDYILGTSSDGTKFEPFTMFVNVEANMDATSEEGNMTPIRIYRDNDDEWSKRGVAVYPPGETTAWYPTQLEGLLDADVTVVSSSATSLVIDVKTACGAIGVTGLVVADFALYDDTPDVESISSSTESTTIDGRYTLNVSTLGADNYTINLNDPSSMTTAGYDKGTDATFVVS